MNAADELLDNETLKRVPRITPSRGITGYQGGLRRWNHGSMSPWVGNDLLGSRHLARRFNFPLEKGMG